MKYFNKLAEKMVKVGKIPLTLRQLQRINTLESENEDLKLKLKEKDAIIKSDLYKEFMAKLEAPHKIIDLQNTLKLRTQQRNAVREDNTKLREELKTHKENSILLEQTIKQHDRYKKQVKTLKDIIKEGK
jgi:hypothetical protein